MASSMALIYKNHYASTYNQYKNLECIMHDICCCMHYKNFSKFILVYQSSFKSHNGIYYMCFNTTENDDEYIIISEKFVSLKEIDSLMKKIASDVFKDGGVITKYV